MLDWQEAWELYQDTHMNPDWYEFAAQYWGDEDETDEEDEYDEP